MRTLQLTCRLTAAILLFSPLLALNVGAWTADPTGENAPTTCKLEPESQCTQAVFIGLEAPGLDMNHASLPQVRFDKANLRGANLSHAIMQLANLQDSNLMLSNLEGAHLHAANLRNSNLMLANLQRVNLVDADLRGANLRGANLGRAILIQANLEDAIWVDGRICGPGSIGECL